MRRRRKAKIRTFCHTRQSQQEEKFKMVLNYQQQYDFANEHRRQLEAEANEARLYRQLGNTKTRKWSFTKLLQPHVVGTNEWCGEEPSMVPVIVKAC